MWNVNLPLSESCVKPSKHLWIKWASHMTLAEKERRTTTREWEFSLMSSMRSCRACLTHCTGNLRSLRFVNWVISNVFCLKIAVLVSLLYALLFSHHQSCSTLSLLAPHTPTVLPPVTLLTVVSLSLVSVFPIVHSSYPPYHPQMHEIHSASWNYVDVIISLPLPPLPFQTLEDSVSADGPPSQADNNPDSSGGPSTRSVRITQPPQAVFKSREALMSRANSLKKAVRQIIEHTEKGGEEIFSQMSPLLLLICSFHCIRFTVFTLLSSLYCLHTIVFAPLSLIYSLHSNVFTPFNLQCS